MPAATALIVGLALGWMCGGTVGNLKNPWLRFEGVVLVLFIAQGLARGRLVSWIPGTSIGAGIWVALCLALVVVLAANINRPGVAVAIVGLLLNVVVVMLNFGMPVGDSPAFDVSREAWPVLDFYHAVSDSTIAPFMADVLPLQLDGAYFVSIGDIALFVAVVTILISAMQPISISLNE